MRNQRMYALRLERGLTQEQVAEAVGITQSAYAMIEGGHRYPRKLVAKKLADFFGVTVDELFFAEDNHAAQWTTGASSPRDCRKAYAGHRTR